MNTAVGCHALLLGIFPTQGSNPGLHIAGGFFIIWATREVHVWVCVCVCVCVYTLSHEKEWDNAIWSGMDEPRDDRGKWSQTKANIIWYHLHVECKIINEIIYKTEQTHRHRMQTYGYQRGKRREEVNEDFGINIDKLLYIK